MGIIEKMRLDGKKGFVTGGARGIGKCTATAFEEDGADVAIVDLDYAEAVKTAKERADKTGRKVIAIETDCTVPELSLIHILAPYAMMNGRFGYRMNNGTLVDTMVNDALWDAFHQYCLLYTSQFPC